MASQITVKGQVTIPKRVREYLGIKPGSGVEFEVGKDGEVVVRKVSAGLKQARPKSRFAAIRGIATAKMSTDEILALTRGEE